MDPSCLEHALTEEERNTFEETGYLIVENVLSQDRIEKLTFLVDSTYERKLAERHDPRKTMFYPNFIPDHDAFLELIDEAKIFPKVWGILGWNIYLYHAHMIVTPPAGINKADMMDKVDKTFAWHQDSGRVNMDIETHPRPRLSLKVAYFLSDCSEPGRGNFWIVPNSHLIDTMKRPEGGIGQLEGAIPVCVKPGTAVFFDRRLWHAASPNGSDITRKVLFYGYGYRWVRTKDDMTVKELWDRCDPIQRQILGDGIDNNGYYSPTDEDVPLRSWIREHCPNQLK